ncbi:hypothetical protein PIB30_088409 [Stylosanthes scabra]|uniref:Aminotransferase-like plant mobile domain-containing protein n=1 Tax=Stylosanthes scabra TaxID=79078 RepID=A0ABU6XW49_9FABA|nr:hypothetical protein [Stylosanthes scabra]
MGMGNQRQDALDTQEDVPRYVQAHILCFHGSLIFPNKSTTYVGGKALCCASRYDCKEMNGPQTLLIAWEWERMPWIAPIPRHELGPPHVPLANRRQEVRLKPMQEYRKEIDDMSSPYGLLWRPYRGMDLPDGLQEELPVSKYFEDLGKDHRITLRGTQHHDWSILHSTWVAKWQKREHTHVCILRKLMCIQGFEVQLTHIGRDAERMLACKWVTSILHCHAYSLVDFLFFFWAFVVHLEIILTPTVQFV